MSVEQLENTRWSILEKLGIKSAFIAHLPQRYMTVSEYNVGVAARELHETELSLSSHMEVIFLDGDVSGPNVLKKAIALKNRR